MDKLRDWISNNEKQFVMVANAAITFIATMFVIVNVYKMIKALSGGQVGDALKNFLYAVLIVVIALIGVMGIKKFVEENKLGNDLIKYGNNP